MSQLPILMLLAAAACLAGCGRSDADVVAQQQKAAFEANKKLTNFQFIPLTPPTATAPVVKSPFANRQAVRAASVTEKDGGGPPSSN